MIFDVICFFETGHCSFCLNQDVKRDISLAFSLLQPGGVQPTLNYHRHNLGGVPPPMKLYVVVALWRWYTTPRHGFHTCHIRITETTAMKVSRHPRATVLANGPEIH